MLDVNWAATIAREAARQDVRDQMEAHDRYYPSWEAEERSMHYAIRNALTSRCRTLALPRFRVVCEYGQKAISNVECPEHTRAKDHPHDIAVLHPLVNVGPGSPWPPGSGFAWASENCAVLGLIEVKKDCGDAASDARWLHDIVLAARTNVVAPGMRPLEWVLLLVVISGRNENDACQQEQWVGQKVAQLARLMRCEPERGNGTPWQRRCQKTMVRHRVLRGNSIAGRGVSLPDAGAGCPPSAKKEQDIPVNQT